VVTAESGRRCSLEGAETAYGRFACVPQNKRHEGHRETRCSETLDQEIVMMSLDVEISDPRSMAINAEGNEALKDEGERNLDIRPG